MCSVFPKIVSAELMFIMCMKMRQKVCLYAERSAWNGKKGPRLCAVSHTLVFSPWCPVLVWPGAGLWREAGNVWTMKACVYAGQSWYSPARGKTHTTGLFSLRLCIYKAFFLCFFFIIISLQKRNHCELSLVPETRPVIKTLKLLNYVGSKTCYAKWNAFLLSNSLIYISKLFILQYVQAFDC